MIFIGLMAGHQISAVLQDSCGLANNRRKKLNITAMKLHPVDVVDRISPEQFRKNYYDKQKPVIIKNLSQDWKAHKKWDWDYINYCAGHKMVGVYNNVKSDAYTPINKADGEMLFSEYLEKVRKGPLQLRIFLFNIFKHAPELKNDFKYPDELIPGFLKKYPMLFVGGQGSVTHMHFDMDMSHVLHTQFLGRKRVLLFDFNQQEKLYRLPFSVLSMVNFKGYYKNWQDEEKYPALQQLEGYDFAMEHGDTLFMPAGYWHHMEYIDAGFAMSLRAMDRSWLMKAKGVKNLFFMRNFDTLMKKMLPIQWGRYKENYALRRAEKYVTHKTPEPVNF